MYDLFVFIKASQSLAKGSFSERDRERRSKMKMVLEGDRHEEEGLNSEVILSSPPSTVTRWPSQDENNSPAHCSQSLMQRMQQDTCFKCHKQGHWAQDCPDKSNSPAHCSQSVIQRMEQDTCFKCNKQGHWAQYCPSTTQRKASSQPSTPEEDIHQLPVLRCYCKVAYRIRGSPGKKYYSRNCKCYDVEATQDQRVLWCQNVKAPICKCGAGACTINMGKGENGERTMYYTCRIRTGHGACGFMQFVTPPNSPNFRTAPRSMERDIMTHENEFPITSFSNRNIVIREVETCNLVMGKGHRVSRLTSRSDIHLRQIEFWNQISAADDSANGCKVLLILGLHVHGWVGRLAFPPPRFLADPPPRHFFCCIFPLFDPILVSENVDVSHSGSSRIMPHAFSNDKVDEVSQNALRNDTQLLGVPSRTSSLKRSFTALQEDVTSPILKGAGKNLQKGLPTQSMERPDHDTILQEANATFDAAECGPFAEFVMKFIQPASRVARMESTVQDNCNLQAPTEHDNIKKCLDDISGLHAEALATLTTSRNHLQSVRKEASRLKDMLLQIENQLHHCEKETSKLETFLQDIIKVVGQLNRSMQTAYQEVKKALNPQPSEEGHCMARTTLEQACSSSSENCRLYLRKKQKMVGNYVNESE